MVIAEAKFVVSSFLVLATIDTMFSPLCYASGSSSTNGRKKSHEPLAFDQINFQEDRHSASNPLPDPKSHLNTLAPHIQP